MVDDKNINKINNKQLADMGLIREEAQDEEGLILVSDKWQELNADCRRSLQIHHNVNHALWYFVMIADGIMAGRQLRDNQKKARRIINHLSCMREFIQPEEETLNQTVQYLLKALLRYSFQRSEDWTYFLYQYWDWIRALAGFFGKDQECFPRENFFRIQKILLNK